MTHISRKRNFQIETSFNPKNISKEYSKNFRLRIMRKKIYLPWTKIYRTDVMDLLIYTNDKYGILNHEQNIVIPFEDFFPTEKISQDSNLHIPNVKYKKHLPAYSESQRLDLELAGITVNEKGRRKSLSTEAYKKNKRRLIK